MSAPSSASRRSGPHQVLLLLYALFTLAAGARAGVQLATDPGRAPLAYALSVVAAVTYALGWFAITRAAEGRTAFARRMLWVELAGVLVVGTVSVLVPSWFPDASVWSDFGIGYGFVPAVLPVAGLLWLHGKGLVDAFRLIAFAEAASWLGLLTGMFFKYVTDSGERGVEVFGPIHGAMFVMYCLLTLLTARRQGWSVLVTLVGLAASIPPFCTVLFELWAQRTGRLDPRGVAGSSAPGRPEFTTTP